MNNEQRERFICSASAVRRLSGSEHVRHHPSCLASVVCVSRVSASQQALLRQHPNHTTRCGEARHADGEPGWVSDEACPDEETDRGVDRMTKPPIGSRCDEAARGGRRRRVEASAPKGEACPHHERHRTCLQNDDRWRGRQHLLPQDEPNQSRNHHRQANQRSCVSHLPRSPLSRRRAISRSTLIIRYACGGRSVARRPS